MRYSLILLIAITIVVASPESTIGTPSNPTWSADKQDSVHARGLPDTLSTLRRRSPARNKGKGKDKDKAAGKEESATQQAQKSAKVSTPQKPIVPTQDSPRHSVSPEASPRSRTSGPGTPTSAKTLAEQKSPQKSPGKALPLTSASSGLPIPRQRQPESFLSPGPSNRLPASGAPDSPPRLPARKNTQSRRQIISPTTSNSPQRLRSPEVGSSKIHAARRKESPDAAELRGSGSSSQGSPRSPAVRKSGNNWEISHTTIQGERQREGGAGGNSPLEKTPIASPTNRSRSGSPIDRWRASSPTFKLWLAGAKEVLHESRGMSPLGNRGDPAVIEAATRSKAAAKVRRAAARRKLGEAQQQMYGGRAMSPTTQRAVVSSAAYSETAIRATKKNADAQSHAGTSLLSTDQHHRVEGHIKAGAREFRRKFSIEAHRNAFWSEYQARLSKEEAEQLSVDSPVRGPAYGRAAMSKMRAVRHADDYYKHRDQYVVTKEQFGDPSSSSTDGEQELRIAPRKKPG